MIIGLTWKDAQLFGLPKYKGKVCVKHPEFDGLRFKRGNCVECQRLANQSNHKKNGHKWAETRRRYYESDLDQFREDRKENYCRNKDSYLARASRRRAVKNEAVDLVNYTKVEIDRAFKDCKLVARWLEHLYSVPFHVDHIVPLATGGSHAPHNFAVISASDNMRKGTRLDFNDYEDPRWVYPT